MPITQSMESPAQATTASFDMLALQQSYRSAALRPADVVAACLERIEVHGDNPVWISRVSADALYARADELARLDAESAARLPLFGIPFAVKDNMDVAGMPTTAGCPAYAYTPERTAPAIQKILDAGGILVGKTNLDQFATGLVGTRSPYGACRNAFDSTYISGGSSSGSAVAVATGMVSFSLGTDTAGSGRVPAAFNNVVGLKPSRGLVSAAGIVPACKSLDCVSIFSLTVADAQRVLRVVEAYDAADPYSRRERAPRGKRLANAFRFGVPSRPQLEFFRDGDAEHQFGECMARLRTLGGTPVEIDFTPFRKAARLLYEGPWAAERYAAIREFLKRNVRDLLSVTRDIIVPAAKYTAADAFDAMYELENLKQQTAVVWNDIDLMLVPTAPTIYGIGEVNANPFQLNANLGYYTNFVNLLDLCGIAIPSGFRDDGLPFGVTLLAPALHEDTLWNVAARCHAAARLPLGATGMLLPKASASALESDSTGTLQLAVVGAHLSGQPLNHQLTSRGATLVRQGRTAPGYRLYALAGTVPAKPALKRTGDAELPGIEVEIWSLSPEAFGAFVADIPAPLGIGAVTLEDGAQVRGFICESYALEGASDISRFGGWRNYLAQSGGRKPGSGS